MNWTQWVHEPGLAFFQNFSTPELIESQQLAAEYIAGGGQSSPANKNDYAHWYSSLRVIFLSELEKKIDQVTLAILQKIDADLGITNTLDPEVKQHWFPMGIRKGYNAVLDPAEKFINSMGRMKYLKPIYIAMIESGKKDTAIQWFNNNKNFYHPYSVSVLAKLLGVTSPEVRAAMQSPLVQKMMKKHKPLRGLNLPTEIVELKPEEPLFLQQ